MKLVSPIQPINLSPWVLFTNSATIPGVVSLFLEKVRSSNRPLTRILEVPERKYRYTVQFDLLEGLLDGRFMGFTAQGIARVESIMKSKQHKTYCVFCAGNCYAYAHYLNLEDAVEVANALEKLSEVSGMWEKVHGLQESDRHE